MDYAEEEVFAVEDAFPRDERLELYQAIDRPNFPYGDIIIQHYFAGNKLSEIAQMPNMHLCRFP